ncbi:hypothetical protein [Ignicoccus hospitalis]|uniref:Uncharacterized protein n=1 Tax=Ignicoccus hospitalis (strain KIN4/I / DSM 18386 / JCM 14125) TaxID=453591 RepID=A8ABW4_IGNH4|nr:hypothetical protein [Ignicoccus hospitalis]ABU82416.1 hypothetical protein Igni_1240 [Ignicoccus hospitalis KIN4/I]HIH90891.1 hypothetical protein [Desulfurococcaceae archaeon]
MSNEDSGGSGSSANELTKLDNLLKVLPRPKEGKGKCEEKGVNEVSPSELLKDLAKGLSNNLFEGEDVCKDDPKRFLEKFLREVLNKTVHEAGIDPNDLEKSLHKELRDSGKGQDDCTVILKDLLEKLKENWDTIDREKKSKLNKILHLFNTCYDDGKAQGLSQALSDVKECIDNQELFCKFLLLAAAVTYLKSEEKLDSRSEWFYEVVRAALTRDKFRFPYCPWKGDAAALFYAYVLCCCGININDEAKITGDDIIKIIKLLIGKEI